MPTIGIPVVSDLLSLDKKSTDINRSKTIEPTTMMNEHGGRQVIDEPICIKSIR
jgi:hypothetical protein